MRVRACALSTLNTTTSDTPEAVARGPSERQPASATRGFSKPTDAAVHGDGGAQRGRQASDSKDQDRNANLSLALVPEQLRRQIHARADLLTAATCPLLDDASHNFPHPATRQLPCAKSISAPMDGCGPVRSRSLSIALRPAGYSSDPTPTSPWACAASSAGQAAAPAAPMAALLAQPREPGSVVPDPTGLPPPTQGKGEQAAAVAATVDCKSWGSEAGGGAHGELGNPSRAVDERMSAVAEPATALQLEPNSADPSGATCSSGSAPAQGFTVTRSLPALLEDLGELSSLGPSDALGSTWLGTWEGRSVAVKLSVRARWDPDGVARSAAVEASRVAHPSLLRVHSIRAARVDDVALREFASVVSMRQGRVARRRPAGQLHSFLTASLADGHHPQPQPGPDAIADGLGVRHSVAPLAWRALSSLRLSPEGGVVATVMEYCELGNLHTLSCSAAWPFRASPSWPLHVAQRALLRTAREIASALAALHAAGVTHGALRPTNVLLAASTSDRRGFEARVSDAGSGSLAEAAANPLAAGPCMVMLSPEALADADAMAAPPADVYAYGMLLYLMAAGEMPFEGQHLVPVLMAVAADGLQPEWPTGQHDHLEQLFRACIARQPGDRPTFEQIVAGLCSLEQRIKDAKRSRRVRSAVCLTVGSGLGITAA